jgi:phosphohistidine phosphatase
VPPLVWRNYAEIRAVGNHPTRARAENWYREWGGAVKTLWLLRHAKASAGGDGADRDRRLTTRGREASSRIGRHLAECGARPELVLCSPSLRTRETLELVKKELGDPLPTEFEDDLYLASERDLRKRIEHVEDSVGSVLLVGHNPGIAELALQLAVRGAPDELEALRHKFPTAALAEFRVDARRWRQFARACELASFVIPKQLSD